MTEHPQYGAYPSPNLPPRSDGVAVTNPASEPIILPVQAPAPKKKRNVGLAIGLALIIAGLAVGGYFALRPSGINGTATPAAATTKAPTPIQAAALACATMSQPEDLGHTLTLDNVSAKEDPGPDDWDVAQCVFRELDVPSYVIDHIGHTRALDGTQSDAWSGMNARWNYHPDHGMNITFYDAK